MKNFYDYLCLSLIAMELKPSESRELSLFLSNENIYEKENSINLISKNFPKIIKKFQNKLVKETIMNKISKWESKGIKFLLLGTNDYPISLKSIFNPPLVLFYKGIWKKDYDYNNSVAIVGSRKACLMQSKFVSELAKSLSYSNICIVSGLAQGIDAASHIGALSNPSNLFPTIAVLGSGVNYIYPSVHKYLAHKIIEEGGVILSHFLPDTSPLPYNFLDRNRVISGLSKIIIVAQAAMKSGALSTARYALEQGRDLLAVLGPVYDEGFEGSNNLITQGAIPIANIDDFYKLYPEYLKDMNLDNIESTITNESEKTVYEYIKKRKKVTRSELYEKFIDLDLPLIIINLQAENYIDSLPGEEYVVR